MFCIPGGRGVSDLFLCLFLGLGGGKPQKPGEWRPLPLTLCQALAPLPSQGRSLQGAGLGEGFPDSQPLLTRAP